MSQTSLRESGSPSTQSRSVRHSKGTLRGRSITSRRARGHGSKAAFKSSAAVPKNSASTIRTVRVFATILQGASTSTTSLLFPSPDPIVKALRELDTSRWPVYKQQDTAELDAYGNDDVSLLVEKHRVFFEHTTGAKVRAQWEQIKQTIKQTIASDPQLSKMEFSVLWPRMLC